MENIEIRHLNMNDYLELKDSMIEVYHTWAGSYWKEHHIETLLHHFGNVRTLKDRRSDLYEVRYLK